jgi:hypothetical protein
VWEDNFEYCVGCQICEVAMRLWRPGPQTLELRFHVKCFNQVIVSWIGRRFDFAFRLCGYY